MSSGSWARLFDRGVRWAVLVPSIGTFAGAWRSVLEEYARLDIAGRSALIGLGILQVVVAVLVLRAVRGWRMELAVVLITGLLLAGFVGGRPESAWPIGWWPTAAVTLVQCWVLVFGSRHRWWIGAAGVLLFAGIRVWAAVLTGAPWVEGVGDVVVATQVPLSVVLGLAAVHQVAARRDAAERDRARALEEETARGAEAARAREVGRFLHDDVSHTLRAVAQARHLDDRSVRVLAGRTVERLQSGNLAAESAPGAAAPNVVERLGCLDGVGGVRVRVTGRAPVLPQDVVDAVMAASTEALRNVSRHAGTKEATIRVRPTRPGVVVSVNDHGRGLPPDAAWGVGIAQSVIGRMAEVGGTADIRSNGRGTTVELVWSPRAAKEWVAGTWRELTRTMTPMVIPGLLGTVTIGLLVLDRLQTPILALLGLLIFAACGGLAVVRGVWLNPIRSYGLLLGAAMAGFAANVFAVSPDTQNGYHLFLAGGAACLLLLVAIQHRFVWSLLAVALVWGAMFGLGSLRFGVDRLTKELVGALTAPFVVLGILLPRAILGHVVRRTLVDRDQTLRSRWRAQHLAQRSGAEDARLRRTRRRVLPFLQAVADGRVEPGDPAVLRQAIRLEAAVRDELRFGATEDAFGEAIDRVRRAGWRVEIRVRPEDRGPVVKRAEALLNALGAKDATTGTAYLSAFGEVALVVRDPSPRKLSEWRSRPDIEVEEGTEWCRLTGRTEQQPMGDPCEKEPHPRSAPISLERA